MIEKIYLIIGIATIGDMIAVRFEPLQPVKANFIKFFSSFHFFYSVLNKVLNCSRCMAFWLYFFIYVDLIAAALAGLVGFLINHLHDRIKHWYE